jgi:hypothetical protein
VAPEDNYSAPKPRTVQFVSEPPVVGMTAREKDRELSKLISHVLATGVENRESFEAAEKRLQQHFPKLFSTETYTRKEHEQLVASFVVDGSK